MQIGLQHDMCSFSTHSLVAQSERKVSAGDINQYVSMYMRLQPLSSSMFQQCPNTEALEISIQSGQKCANMLNEDACE